MKLLDRVFKVLISCILLFGLVFSEHLPNYIGLNVGINYPSINDLNAEKFSPNISVLYGLTVNCNISNRNSDFEKIIYRYSFYVDDIVVYGNDFELCKIYSTKILMGMNYYFNSLEF